MFNNVALDVVIGLVFVFLLYSLFATVVVEIIATKLGLRARNLKEAVDRMLNDEDDDPNSYARRFWLIDKLARLSDSMRLLKNPKNPIVDRFYDHPEIKYLGSSGVFKNPSSFKAVSFSKTLLYLLNGAGPMDKERIDNELRNVAPKILGPQTTQYVLSLWEDSHGDIVKFKLQLEAWFERTMEQATEWYKRKIRIVLLVLGFMLAWMFNADTFVIIRKLANDKSAREQMVQMATSYIQNNPRTAPANDTVSPGTVSLDVKLDSLLAVQKRLQADMQNANSLLGAGSWLPDSISINFDEENKRIYPVRIESDILPGDQKNATSPYTLHFDGGDKWRYFFRILGKHFWGFLVFAIAISLGATFWFDLLNKLIRLRTSIKQPADSVTARFENTVSPLNREG